ncbi:KPN_02809 family neutral zinc metallopeptidase [Acinetobacter rathckeae]|uniref:KPN_02809 family neutral zinc metallopeptidase n=1 Tax=Acinetobacter rathckeae TaxID=2605272 RepID=UPI0018A2CA8C|nr:neutral zinc metallopeptidase [Acinetobacter rathckeae]MBF7687332.1 neutral zinc metallopeptidase [Acinetobacter rathckeae]MBF7695918.1 neutral zinc metallopeptidase [Acinetobacter rathckeae]
MRWKDREQSTNVEDRRGGGAVKTGGISIVGLVVAFVAWKFFGADPQQAYQVTKQITSQSAGQTQGQALRQPTAEQAESKQFVTTVLADTEKTWSQIFKEQGKQYTPPTIVLYSGTTATACGTGQAAMGPFYCPADQKVYLDTTFFQDMRSKMGISGEKNQTELNTKGQAGDFAMAYVIAHEVGHHVQTLLGISKQVSQLSAKSSQKIANQLSVRQELQADCFSGVWAKRTNDREHFLDEGDIAEAMDAAQKIGDDYLQKRATGQIVPDSFTHGTSAQRMHWFDRGFQSGNISSCDSFGQEI